MAGNDLELCQRQADEVTEIMLNNYERVLERDGKLSDLEQRSDDLVNMSAAFTKTTKTLAKKKSWEKRRWCLIVGLVVGGVVLLLTVILLVVFLTPGEGG
ncbi:vesicle-associated membrane protein 5 isoform X2 [Tachyglossus aculeatus]|uniref:vesicle-associated membrane protein 5 isoform X1 n=1 Tax=Tachyglossus aculeatus TaxID=9261 RepID=UPI0018F56D69|nr:vesicle-associated membrane protein 5 isoform X1 [Tachyglossus aculeatus]XP_038610410.1 vesicle-associated membrane protein 5 isoform X2 [Tachyglossus aculeatus]